MKVQIEIKQDQEIAPIPNQDMGEMIVLVSVSKQNIVQQVDIFENTITFYVVRIFFILYIQFGLASLLYTNNCQSCYSNCFRTKDIFLNEK